MRTLYHDALLSTLDDAGQLLREELRRLWKWEKEFQPHQVKRLGSSWAYSTGRTKSRARRVVAFIRERPSERQRAEISIA